MNQVRLGVIGLGNIGQFHTNYLLNGGVQRAALTAVCDAVPARLQAFRDRGLQGFENSAEMIRSGEIDAVLIATPHYFHTDVGIDALQNGLHVLVEKPIAVHKADAERLLAAHTDKALVFAAMFNQRTDTRFCKIKELLTAGDLGTVQRVTWIITDWFRTDAYFASSSWRATWKGEGGGVLLNQCPHQLDLLQWLVGMPRRVHAFCGLGKYHPIEVEDEVTAYLEYDQGATGVFITTTGESPGTNRLEIAGDRGRLVLEGDCLTLTQNEVSAREYCHSSAELFGHPQAHSAMLPVNMGGGQHVTVSQNFVDAILDGTPLIAPAEEGIRSVELINAMLYSHFTRQTVELPLDGAAYEQHLQALIANSTFHKPLREAQVADITKSFR